ncbi:hypothetical protein [Lysobacter capsici]|uniref:hypothetical protein n=1 Tax=Lysobacter capsici TaxID=435897 RepID=UPI00287B839B|nr:hypothetical protein [Lysobacter capsici]WND82927.1 hypothetical protein RJ610_11525 [Lysobacter capsici]WND88125.1 hypothetical protein RJ609_11535 [Lysobacter capsici]
MHMSLPQIGNAEFAVRIDAVASCALTQSQSINAIVVHSRVADRPSRSRTSHAVASDPDRRIIQAESVDDVAYSQHLPRRPTAQMQSFRTQISEKSRANERIDRPRTRLETLYPTRNYNSQHFSPV